MAANLGVGYSTLQTWIPLTKKNKLEKPQEIMTKEKSPQNWTKTQRLEAIMMTYQMTEEYVASIAENMDSTHFKYQNNIVTIANKKTQSHDSIIKKELVTSRPILGLSANS